MPSRSRLELQPHVGTGARDVDQRPAPGVGEGTGSAELETRSSVGTEQYRRDIRDHPLRVAAFDNRAEQLAATLDEGLEHALPPEHCERGIEVDTEPGGARRDHLDLGACPVPPFDR